MRRRLQEPFLLSVDKALGILLVVVIHAELALPVEKVERLTIRPRLVGERLFKRRR